MSAQSYNNNIGINKGNFKPKTNQKPNFNNTYNHNHTYNHNENRATVGSNNFGNLESANSILNHLHALKEPANRGSTTTTTDLRVDAGIATSDSLESFSNLADLTSFFVSRSSNDSAATATLSHSDCVQSQSIRTKLEPKSPGDIMTNLDDLLNDSTLPKSNLVAAKTSRNANANVAQNVDVNNGHDNSNVDRRVEVEDEEVPQASFCPDSNGNLSMNSLISACEKDFKEVLSDNEIKEQNMVSEQEDEEELNENKENTAPPATVQSMATSSNVPRRKNVNESSFAKRKRNEMDSSAHIGAIQTQTTVSTSRKRDKMSRSKATAAKFERRNINNYRHHETGCRMSNDNNAKFVNNVNGNNNNNTNNQGSNANLCANMYNSMGLSNLLGLSFLSQQQQQQGEQSQAGSNIPQANSFSPFNFAPAFGGPVGTPSVVNIDQTTASLNALNSFNYWQNLNQINAQAQAQNAFNMHNLNNTATLSSLSNLSGFAAGLGTGNGGPYGAMGTNMGLQAFGSPLDNNNMNSPGLAYLSALGMVNNLSPGSLFGNSANTGNLNGPNQAQVTVKTNPESKEEETKKVAFKAPETSNNVNTVPLQNNISLNLYPSMNNINFNFELFVPDEAKNPKSLQANNVAKQSLPIVGSDANHVHTVSISQKMLKKSKRRKSAETEEDDDLLESSGQWTKAEEGTLLHLVRSMVECELKIIARAARFCGIFRQPRAVDKKLKRLIGFKNWKQRQCDDILVKLERVLSFEPRYKLDDEMSEKISEAVKIYRYQT